MRSNTVAKDVRSSKYRMRVVRARKGPGSWRRKPKHAHANG